MKDEKNTIREALKCSLVKIEELQNSVTRNEEINKGKINIESEDVQRTNVKIIDVNKEEKGTERIIKVIKNKERLNRYETRDNIKDQIYRNDKICKNFSMTADDESPLTLDDSRWRIG